MNKSIKNILNFFNAPTKKTLAKPTKQTTVSQLKKISTTNLLTSQKARGLFDTIESCMYMDTGEVIAVSNRFTKRVTNNNFDSTKEIHQWAIFRKLITHGELILVR